MHKAKKHYFQKKKLQYFNFGLQQTQMKWKGYYESETHALLSLISGLVGVIIFCIGVFYVIHMFRGATKGSETPIEHPNRKFDWRLKVLVIAYFVDCFVYCTAASTARVLGLFCLGKVSCILSEAILLPMMLSRALSQLFFLVRFMIVFQEAPELAQFGHINHLWRVCLWVYPFLFLGCAIFYMYSVSSFSNFDISVTTCETDGTKYATALAPLAFVGLVFDMTVLILFVSRLFKYVRHLQKYIQREEREIVE